MWNYPVKNQALQSGAALTLIVAFAIPLSGQVSNPVETTEAVAGAAAKWRNESVSQLLFAIKKSNEEEQLVLRVLRRSGSSAKKMADERERERLKTIREGYSRKIAELKELQGDKLLAAYQESVKAELARQQARAAEERRQVEHQKADEKREAIKLQHARQIFGNVRLVKCDQCQPAVINPICVKCSSTGWAPER